MKNKGKEIKKLEQIRDNVIKDESMKKVINEIIKSKQNEEQENRVYKVVEDFADQFEQDMEIKQDTKKIMEETPILMNLFNQFVNTDYEPSLLDKKVLKIKNQLQDELKKNLTEKQLILLEEMNYCNARLRENMVEQAFIYGYAMCAQMKNEAIKKYPRKDIE